MRSTGTRIRRHAGGIGLGLAALAAASGDAAAAGYALKEQLASGQGNAFAGAAAAAEDVSYMFFNPASLGYIDRLQMEAVATYIAPRTELKDADASTMTGAPIAGSDEDEDIGEDALVPALYAAAPLPGKLHLGVGINAPFGLETRYTNGWAGRYHGVKSNVLTVNINPALAWRPVPWISLGAGLQAQYADGNLTNAVDFGSIGARLGVPGATPGAQDGFAKVEGDDWAYGYTLGAIVEPVQGTRLGVGYRSNLEHNLEGDADFDGDAAGIAAMLRGASGMFVDGPANVAVEMPASLSFGAYHELTRRVAVMGEAQWTDWSTFHELRVDFENPAQPDSVTEQRWNDSWFYALGVTFKATDTLTLRTGVAYDQSPVRNEFRTPRIPDEDRYWLSVGAGWEPTDWIELNAGYTHIFVDDASVDLRASDRGNQFRGNLRAEYEADVDLIAVSAKLRF